MSYPIKVAVSCGIPDELPQTPLPEVWGRASKHMGPEHYSPLKRQLDCKTSAAHFSIISASMIWAANRVRGSVDTRLVEALATAIFCFTVDPRYLRPDIRYRVMPITKAMDFAQGLMTIFPWVFFTHHFQWPGRWPVYPPLTIASRAIYLTRSAMPKGYAGYDAWVEAILGKFERCAALRDRRTEPMPKDTPAEELVAEARRVMGFAIGPEALDPAAPFDAEANALDVDQTLRSIDWSANPFLHSPTEMRVAGFKAVPYAVDK